MQHLNYALAFLRLRVCLSGNRLHSSISSLMTSIFLTHYCKLSLEEHNDPKLRNPTTLKRLASQHYCPTFAPLSLPMRYGPRFLSKLSFAKPSYD